MCIIKGKKAIKDIVGIINPIMCLFYFQYTQSGITMFSNIRIFNKDNVKWIYEWFPPKLTRRSRHFTDQQCSGGKGGAGEGGDYFHLESSNLELWTWILRFLWIQSMKWTNYCCALYSRLTKLKAFQNSWWNSKWDF